MKGDGPATIDCPFCGRTHTAGECRAHKGGYLTPRVALTQRLRQCACHSKPGLSPREVRLSIDKALAAKFPETQDEHKLIQATAIQG